MLDGVLRELANNPATTSKTLYAATMACLPQNRGAVTEVAYQTLMQVCVSGASTSQIRQTILEHLKEHQAEMLAGSLLSGNLELDEDEQLGLAARLSPAGCRKALNTILTLRQTDAETGEPGCVEIRSLKTRLTLAIRSDEDTNPGSSVETRAVFSGREIGQALAGFCEELAKYSEEELTQAAGHVRVRRPGGRAGSLLLWVTALTEDPRTQLTVEQARVLPLVALHTGTSPCHALHDYLQGIAGERTEAWMLLNRMSNENPSLTLAQAEAAIFGALGEEP